MIESKYLIRWLFNKTNLLYSIKFYYSIIKQRLIGTFKSRYLLNNYPTQVLKLLDAATNASPERYIFNSNIT